MKSNKQRRAEINAKRLARAERLQAQLRAPNDGRIARLVGSETADPIMLARFNTSVALPTLYVDREFCCRDCGEPGVWTAKQQKWWHETMGGNISSTAVRCLACRRKHRAQKAISAAGVGADALGETTRWLRSVGARQQDPATLVRVEALLTSKWDSVRQLAIEVLGRWQRPQDFERLRLWATTGAVPVWRDRVRHAAVKALVPLLRHPRDDAWLWEACVANPWLWRPANAHFHQVPAHTLNDLMSSELQRNDPGRLSASIVVLMDARRTLSPPHWRQLAQH